jgi:DNA ligase-1|tara:strand:+ start:1338 stop:3128 length:1791 start_codon:yes stop_codon:yes gene_type:complete
MEFSIIAKTLENMEGTTKRLELTDFLVGLFKETPQDLLPKIVYLIQSKIRPDFEGIELGMAEKLAIRSLSKSSGTPVKKIQEIYQDDGDLGHSAEKILQLKKQTTFVNEPITLERVYDTFFKIAKTEGKGSQDMKIKYISSLLNDAMPIDGKFILKILLGTLRLGVADNTIIDALTIAFTGSKEKRHQVEDAYNVSSDLGKVAQVISEEGINGVEKFQISIFNPVRPMLADRVKSESEALEKMGEKFAAEYKLDGERVQVHLKNKQVILFSRRLENITKFYPDIVENISKSLKTREAILEAEAVAVNENTGEFLPFQELMHRRRKYNLERAVSEIPITLNFFDVLYFDGKNCLGLSYEERRKNLEEIVIEDKFAKLVPMVTVTTDDQIEDFLENSINSGCEGLMLKSLEGQYRAGMRGSNWLKLKREYRNELGDSLDLVVIGAFFGKGRRTGRYGTLLVATYNDENDTFSSICKVGTGFTDENLDQLYQILSNKVTLKKNQKINSEMESDVWFDPELVIEVVASEITLSPIHKTATNIIRKGSGLALRFPKFTGKIRLEKSAEDASTDREIVALYQGQIKIGMKNRDFEAEISRKD